MKQDERISPYRNAIEEIVERALSRGEEEITLQPTQMNRLAGYRYLEILQQDPEQAWDILHGAKRGVAVLNGLACSIVGLSAPDRDGIAGVVQDAQHIIWGALRREVERDLSERFVGLRSCQSAPC